MRYLVFLGVLLAALPALARDYLVVGSKPSLLHVVDVAARKVVRTIKVPGRGAIFTISTTDDGKTAYVLTDGLGTIMGFDLDSGKMTFRANLSYDDVRVKNMFAMAATRDGKELWSYQSRTRLKPSEYEVLDTRIAVYDTAAGKDAKPVRSFPAPRGLSALLPSTDGKTMYAIGWEIYAFDTKTGMIKKTIGLRHWDRPNFASPDALVMWPNYSQSNVFVSPYFTVRTDKKPGEPGFAITGVMTLDLKTGQHRFIDYEDTKVLIFSMIMNPVRRNEVYGTYTTMSKVDLNGPKLVKRFNQKHTYYTVNVSSDGKELYAGGTMDDIAVFDTRTMDQIATIMIPGGGDMGASSMRMISRPALSE